MKELNEKAAKELAELLASLNVEFEQPGDPPAGDTRTFPPPPQKAAPTVTITCPPIHAQSRRLPGVFYRSDLVDGQPELRIYVGVTDGITRLAIFIVTFAEPVQDVGMLDTLLYPTREECAIHLLFAYSELLKTQFWQGDPDAMVFPPSIRVRQVRMEE
jgi:hypothetical protein